MRKRILAFLLAMAMITTMPSALSMNVKAETTEDGSKDTSYESETNPGNVDSKDIKEWRDKTNEADLFDGWYHFKGEDTGWKALNLKEKDPSSDAIRLFYLELWKKSGNSYKKIMDAESSYGNLYSPKNFHMEKDTDYYIYVKCFNGCSINMDIRNGTVLYDPFWNDSDRMDHIRF